MNKTTLAVISAVSGGVLGGVITYISVNKTLRGRYSDLAKAEIESVKEHYRLLRKDSPELYVPTPGEPFLITEEEYFENTDDYEMDTLTYYELDDTLTDEHNQRIERVEETIGERHLTMFKKNGTKKASLYIRNDDHTCIYEVILVEQSYAAVHLGVDEEDLGLRDPKPRTKKMKRDDD